MQSSPKVSILCDHDSQYIGIISSVARVGGGQPEDEGDDQQAQDQQADDPDEATRHQACYGVVLREGLKGS